VSESANQAVIHHSKHYATMLNVLQKATQQLKDEWQALGYEILMEADVVGWLFHFLVTQPEVQQEVHLDTRVCNAKGRFDLAIGPIKTRANKPCIQPKCVIEVKIFPRIGVTEQQHRVHYKHILDDDLLKLSELDPTIEFCAMLMVDGRGYLEGTYQDNNRKEYLIRRRNQIAPRVHVFIIRLVDGSWQDEHSAPSP
jgi:hypothetical protein